MNTFEAIQYYGLSIRQIPLQVISKYNNPKDGDVIVEENGRKYSLHIKTPKYGGYWMCKQTSHTDSFVNWSIKTDNLAKTLDESVALFLSKIKGV